MKKWKWLFQEIEKNSSYEVLILDLGGWRGGPVSDPGFFAMKFTFDKE